MVYVVAAYSITIGVLLVYGVLLQHRARVARARGLGLQAGSGDGGAASAAVTQEAGRGFNLGAALLAPFWAWAHGQRMAGTTLLVTLVACVAAWVVGLRVGVLLLGTLLLGASLFFGVVGNRIVAARVGHRDPVGCAQTQLPWALVGAVLYAVLLPWACYFAMRPG